MNDWKIVSLAAKNDCPEDDLEEAKMIVLESLTENTANEIKIGNVGAFSTEDPTYEGFYLVEWSSEPFEAEEDQLLTDYDPPMFVKKGDLLAKAKYLDIVPRAPDWWCPIDQTVTVRVQQVLAGSVQLMDHSSSNQLPRTCNRTEAIQKGSKKLCPKDREKILHKILVQSVLDFEEREEGAESEAESGDELLSDEDGDLSDDE